MTETLVVSGTSTGASTYVESLANTVSSSSTGANLIFLLKTVTLSGSVADDNTAVEGDFRHITLSLNGSTLTLNSDAGNDVTMAAAESSTLTGGAISMTKSS